MTPAEIEIGDQEIRVRTTAGQKLTILSAYLPPVAAPLVKWAGGKQWLAPAATSLLPAGWTGKYYEPFIGGGAMFFSTAPSRAVLSDRNEDLMKTYVAVRDDPDSVIRLLNSYPYDEKFYYRIRARIPRNDTTRAARFLYLNRCCWNGLYRVNRDGKFNTPFGRFVNPTICDRERIRAAARILQKAEVRSSDFEISIESAAPGDFVYFDPPYVSGHQNNGFLKYNAPLFAWGDQKRLSDCAIALAELGVNVLVSNADHPAVIRLYKGFRYYRAKRRSLIGASCASRGIVREALLSSYALFGLESEIIS
jgi:DNA adenine methylase